MLLTSYCNIAFLLSSSQSLSEPHLFFLFSKTLAGNAYSGITPFAEFYNKLSSSEHTVNAYDCHPLPSMSDDIVKLFAFFEGLFRKQKDIFSCINTKHLILPFSSIDGSRHTRKYDLERLGKCEIQQ